MNWLLLDGRHFIESLALFLQIALPRNRNNARLIWRLCWNLSSSVFIAAGRAELLGPTDSSSWGGWKLLHWMGFKRPSSSLVRVVECVQGLVEEKELNVNSVLGTQSYSNSPPLIVVVPEMKGIWEESILIINSSCHSRNSFALRFPKKRKKGLLLVKANVCEANLLRSLGLWDFDCGPSHRECDGFLL